METKNTEVEETLRAIEYVLAHPDEGSGDIHTDLTKILHQQLQKARQTWLREEIVKLNGVLAEIHNVDGEAWGYELLKKIGSCCPGDDAANVYKHALQTIINRYLLELKN